MALRDVLVYVDQTQSALPRLRLAADLAARSGSRLTALFVHEWSQTQLEQRATAELGLVSPSGVDQLLHRTENTIQVAAGHLQSALDALARERGLLTAWRMVEGPASVVVAQHARYADLCIAGPILAADDGSVDYKFSEELLFVTGRPVLFVPCIPPCATLGRHIAVAWNSSRPAARAVNDALPLIECSERTTVLTVNPAEFIDRHGAPPAEQMVEHLRRHGALADLQVLKHVPSRSIADALQAKARDIGADLLVAGAFGHARLWEKLLGGVTRDLLDHMSLPIFMSH